MAEELKRMNYFDFQFLKAEDFQDEQAYHLTVRRLLNSSLYSPGVVDGLNVQQVADRVVRITPGLAIDKDGQAIIVLEPMQYTLTTSTPSVFLTAAFEAHQPDSGSDAFFDPINNQPTRTFERPRFAEQAQAPSADDEAILLATLLLTNGRITGVDNDSRLRAAPRGIDSRQVVLDAGGSRRYHIRADPDGLNIHDIGANIPILRYTAPTQQKRGLIELGNDACDFYTHRVFWDTIWGLVPEDRNNLPLNRGADVAELYLSDMVLAPGDVVCLDREQERIVLSDQPNDALVLGMISTNPRFVLDEAKSDG